MEILYEDNQKIKKNMETFAEDMIQLKNMMSMLVQKADKIENL